MRVPAFPLAVLGRTALLPWVLLAAVPGGLLSAPDGMEPEAKRVAEIASMIPSQPVGVGRPIDDRAAWKHLGFLPGYDEIIDRARRELDAPLPPMTEEIFLDFSRTGNRNRGQRVIRERHGRFPLLVLAECLEAKGRFLPAIEKAVQSVCEEATWVLPAHDRSLANFRGETVEIDLNSAATSWNLATAAFWLGEKLDAPTRKLIRSELERRTFQPYEESVRTGTPRLWWVTGTNNWNAVCHAGVIGAALAAIESKARRAFFIAAAEKNIEHFLRGFTPDGYCSEGLGYWNYGFGHHVLLAETIHRATGGKLDMLSRPEVTRIACFGPRMEILPGVYPAFADCSLSSRPDSRILAFLGQRLGIDLGEGDPSVLTRPTTSLFTLGVYGFPHAGGQPPRDRREPAAGTLRDWFPDATATGREERRFRFSSSDGWFRLRRIPAGQYTLRLVVKGSVRATAAEVEVLPGKETGPVRLQAPGE